MAGNKVLAKPLKLFIAQRARAYFGPSDLQTTREADVNATQNAVNRGRRRDSRNVMPWSFTAIARCCTWTLAAETLKRTVSMPFAWKPDTWYRLKLQ